ncbi:Surface presentation of antigens (SPOA) [Legionella moravica]|uniref:Flagellar motor switch/type III secretory pathway protein n=1 Tax=Legionella moravica TaxID=39962 RepID=A0A378JV64_9GAMM|nr:FliM/FliN family flagellar motor C-terminal domain-containing protein [Legionella moravica]KTD35295.1 Surface presentation of antigens (SPOA) [Legionella moravica]STX62326.1 Flagellar motor switch/type III secretory pathway protein [Legionella moravica]
MTKPFRLINSFELQELSRQLLGVINDWNTRYSLNPVTMELHLPPKECSPFEGYLIQDNASTLACIDVHYLSTLNQALFGKDSPCFNSVSEELFSVLIQQILKVDACTVDTKTCSVNKWFYRGSTSLLLRLTCNANQFTLVLHPDWVYQILPKWNSRSTKPIALEEALSDQQIKFTLELDPITLPLHQLMSLSSGDVIATDHPTCTPVSLTHNHQLIARAELGKSAEYKSISLKGAS